MHVLFEMLSWLAEYLWPARRGHALPPLAGLPLAEARTVVVGLGYSATVDRADALPTDLVVDQRPRPGRRAGRDGGVQLRLAPPTA